MKEKYLKSYETGRYNLIVMSAFTLINIILLLLGSDMYFLFSAAIPYFTAIFPHVLAVEIPSYASWILPLAGVSALMLVPYVLAFFLGKNPEKYGWMIFALVCFAIDTAGFFILFGISVEGIVDLIFHLWVLVYLILAVRAGAKLKALSHDMPEATEIKQMPEA